MIGIRSFGAYVPLWRISCEEIGKAWGRAIGKGERSVACEDEDRLTTAVEAAVDCLNGIERRSVDDLIFVSTTSPLLGKQTSMTVAVGADLNRSVFSDPDLVLDGVVARAIEEDDYLVTETGVERLTFTDQTVIKI